MAQIEALDWYEKGQAFEEKKQYTQALSAYKQATRLDPHVANFFAAYGKMLYILGFYREAESAFTNALKIDANLSEACIGCAHTLRHLQQYKPALKLYRQAILLDPDNADAYNGLGIALGKLKRFAEAIGAFRVAVRLNPAYPQYHHNLGRAFQEAYRYTDALDEFNKAINLDPSYVQAYHHKGQLLLHLNREQEGLECLTRALKLEPDNKDILSEYNRAVAAQNVVQQPTVTPGRISAKATKQSKIASVNTPVKDPSDIPTLFQAKTLYQAKQYAASLKIYQKILKRNIDSIDAWIGSILASFRLGQWNSAIKMCDNALIRFEKKGKLYCLKGDILFAAKKYKEAKAAYDSARAYGYTLTDLPEKVKLALQKISNPAPKAVAPKTPIVSVETPNLEASDHQKTPIKPVTKRYSKPIESPELAELNPSHPLLKRGETMLRRRYYKEAQEAFEQLLLEDPHNAHAYHGLGCALRALGEEEKSLQAFHKAHKFGL